MAINTELLLFIEPRNKPSKEPIIDELTKKMTASLRKAKMGTIRNYSITGKDYTFNENDHWKGWHTCSCGATTGTDYLLPNGEMTNGLCIHYLAYHRDEIPQDQLDRVNSLNDGREEPYEKELNKKI